MQLAGALHDCLTSGNVKITLFFLRKLVPSPPTSHSPNSCPQFGSCLRGLFVLLSESRDTLVDAALEERYMK